MAGNLSKLAPWHIATCFQGVLTIAYEDVAFTAEARVRVHEPVKVGILLL